MQSLDGIILVNKPIGWTSQDVCSKIKHILKVKRIGHTGTLDPFATGLLIVSVGKATKVSRFIEGLKKTYSATIKLGIKTSSGDLTGEIIQETSVPSLEISKVKKTLSSFLGKSQQLPPMTSAIKVNGKKLYEYSRLGLEIERKTRDIEVFDISLSSLSNELMSFTCTVSKGTYIRTLGEDIAKRLGTVGHLISLNRDSIGRYSCLNAFEIKDVNQSSIIPLNKALDFMSYAVVSGENLKKVLHGQDIFLESDDDILAIKDEKGDVLAIYQKTNDKIYHCLRGLYENN